MKNKNLVILIFACIFTIIIFCGTGYASWLMADTLSTSNSIGFTIPTWDFVTDYGFAVAGNVLSTSYLTASQETSITCGSPEAVRFTNEAGTSTKDHIMCIAFDRDYTVGEIKIQKISFDYYHIAKRQQQGKGFPKLQLLNGTSGKGNTIGGGESVTAISPFTAVEINNGWWHLEYFITAMTPTFADHGDSGISEKTIINGVKIIDSAIYNFDGDNKAFVVVDNLQISSAACTKLGLFNKGATITAGNYYWMKVAWAGTLHNCVITFSDDGSDDPVCEYTPSAKSPFYVKARHAGTVVATCTLEIGDEHQILSISNTLTIN